MCSYALRGTTSHLINRKAQDQDCIENFCPENGFCLESEGIRTCECKSSHIRHGYNECIYVDPLNIITNIFQLKITKNFQDKISKPFPKYQQAKRNIEKVVDEALSKIPIYYFYRTISKGRNSLSEKHALVFSGIR